MSGCLNKTTLIGYVAEDPQVRGMQDGSSVASFRIGTSESWKDKQTGEIKSVTEWHTVSVFNPHLVEVIRKYVTKGSRLYVEGQSKTRKWVDKDGSNRYSTEVVLSQFNGQILLLTTKESGSGEGQKQQHNPNVASGGQEHYSPARGQGYQQQQSSPFPQAGAGLDDEVPF